MYWNLTDVDPATGEPTPGRRPMGCEGLDAPYETWPYRNNIKPNYASPAMNCGVNDYAPEGRELHEIIDDLAMDNEHFAEKFFEGWDIMTSNGYSEEFTVMEDLMGLAIGEIKTRFEYTRVKLLSEISTDPYTCL